MNLLKKISLFSFLMLSQVEASRKKLPEGKTSNHCHQLFHQIREKENLPQFNESEFASHLVENN